MAVTWRTIQTLARDLAKDTKLDVTSSEGLVYGMRVYRQFAAMWRWPELTRKNTALTTVAAQERYSATAIASFRDITMVELQDDRDGDKYVPVSPTNSEMRWARAGYQAAGFPDFYRLEDSAGVPKLAFRPVPNTAQATNLIRVTGQVVPADISATNTTFPRHRLADDLLAHMVAADRLSEKGQQGRADLLRTRAQDLFVRISGQEVVPAELAIKREE